MQDRRLDSNLLMLERFCQRCQCSTVHSSYVAAVGGKVITTLRCHRCGLKQGAIH